MGFLAAHRSRGSRRCGATLILATVTAALTMAIAAPAQAHAPNTAKAWGKNKQGQLGNGESGEPGGRETCPQYLEAPACSTTPVAVSGVSGVTAAAGGGILENNDFSLALLEDGKVMAWGSGFSGQLGDGTTSSSDVPVEVTGFSAPVKAAVAGGGHEVGTLKGRK